jgi:hypothetical protein
MAERLRPRGLAEALDTMTRVNSVAREPSHPLGTVLPMNADEGPQDGMIDLELLGLPTACWKCGGSTVALVAVSPSGAPEDDELFQTDEPAALAFAAAHLPVGVLQVGTIKKRSSRTAGETYLSNGCCNCDALLGNFFLFHEELLEVLVTEGRKGLRVLATVSVPVIDWEAAQSANIS